jgi:hypothetical protein
LYILAEDDEEEDDDIFKILEENFDPSAEDRKDDES